MSRSGSFARHALSSPHALARFKVHLRCALLLSPLLAAAQSLTLSNGVQTFASLTNTTVTLTGRCELRITGTNNPIPSCLINLNTADSFFVMQNIKPSTVVASYLSEVRVNGAVAVADSNCRVVQYGI